MQISDLHRAKQVEQIKSKSKPYTIKRGLLVVGFVFLFILTSIAWSHDQFTTNTTALADGQNLVSVYYDGQNKTVATGAATVGEALQKMDIELQKGDVVEPSVDKPLTLGVTNINVYRSISYVVEDGGKHTTTSSGYRSPRKVVENSGVPIYPEDTITTERVDSFVDVGTLGQKIAIERATPVTVVLAGKTFQFRTHKKTVGELFTEKGIEVKPQDVVRTSLDTPVQPGMQIVVNRLAQHIITEEVGIEPSVVQRVDSDQAVGYSAVQDPGTPGKKTLSFLVTEQDGAVQGKQLLDEKVTVEAKPKVIIVGPVAVSSDTEYKLYIYNHESGNNPTRRNGSGCIGIGQACPGSKLLQACPNLDYACEDRYFTNYAMSRYGSWRNAYLHWLTYRSW